MTTLNDWIPSETKTIAIAGHVHPDGDCLGACAALFHYLRNSYPDADIRVYLEEPKEQLLPILRGVDRLEKEASDSSPEVFLTIDVSTIERIGVVPQYLQTAPLTICIDHHVSNTGFANIDHIVPEASSACEVLYELLIPDRIDLMCASALYTGIVHDTGVFQYPNTGKKTMAIASELIGRGVPASRIIEETFRRKSVVQQKLLGRALVDCELLFDGAAVLSVTDEEILREYGGTARDVDEIVSILRDTDGTKLALFIYQVGPDEFKVSFRSNDRIDVQSIASRFGGGGHRNAAGCTIPGPLPEVRERLLAAVEEALKGST